MDVDEMFAGVLAFGALFAGVDYADPTFNPTNDFREYVSTYNDPPFDGEGNDTGDADTPDRGDSRRWFD